MVSARRAARMAPAVRSDDEPPEWLWRFSAASFFARPADEPSSLESFVAARRRWREARDEWLLDRGLVMWGMTGMTFQEYNRIEREEPHRVLRRPDRNPIQPG